jgi:hypothetical protein
MSVLFNLIGAGIIGLTNAYKTNNNAYKPDNNDLIFKAANISLNLALGMVGGAIVANCIRTDVTSDFILSTSIIYIGSIIGASLGNYIIDTGFYLTNRDQRNENNLNSSVRICGISLGTISGLIAGIMLAHEIGECLR